MDALRIGSIDSRRPIYSTCAFGTHDCIDGLCNFGSSWMAYNDISTLLCGGADLHLILAGVFARGRVDDHGHVLVFHEVDDVGTLAAGEFGKNIQGLAGTRRT